jgi:pimeloyl-ACP methyl ester carboxylesterase
LAGPATLGEAGCAVTRPDFVAIKAPVAEAGMVFVVDGAGDFRACSEHVRAAVEQNHLPLQVVTVVWSHGYLRIIADQIGYTYARSQGCKLARGIERFQREHPGVPVHLVGHSAGAAVVVAALENLPPESVDRAFLLAPSLSAAYDVRPALAAVRHGLHVFYSRRDTKYLSAWTGILGNSDRRWGPSSGIIGFQIPPFSPADAHFYGKLIQRAWQPADLANGNDGKHYGDYQPGFVREQILPFMMSNTF